MHFEIPSNLESICTAEAEVRFNFSKLSTITRNRMLKTLTRGWHNYGYSSIIGTILQQAGLQLYLSPGNQYHSLSEEQKHTFRALCAASGYQIKNASLYGFNIEKIQQNHAATRKWRSTRSDSIPKKLFTQLENMVPKPVHKPEKQAQIDQLLLKIKNGQSLHFTRVLLR